jgi:hypothetical protein
MVFSALPPGEKAEAAGDLQLVAKLLEQAARKCGDAYLIGRSCASAGAPPFDFGLDGPPAPA